MTLDELRARRAIRIGVEKAAGARMFLGFPDRWYEKAHYRCANDHVSTCILKSEERGDLCLECQTSVLLTFPEDVDGPLRDPQLLRGVEYRDGVARPCVSVSGECGEGQ